MAYELADRYPGVPQVFVNHSDAFDPSSHRWCRASSTPSW